MGKTASGTCWVSRNKTSVFDFYQAWINSFDEDVERSLAFFTRLDMNEIKKMCQEDIRNAKKTLAFEVTKLVHGEKEAKIAQETSENLFSNNHSSEHMPNINISKKDLNLNIIDLLLKVKLVTSKSEGRRLISQQGISLNKEKIKDENRLITKQDFNNDFLILQKGKKIFLKVTII